ncbi:unnamed protein product [Spirodela intermedia]|uniref:Uncharacterized protein n=1 Tax=Spirodela intermedia TaxID=51605 RepID=A0A7I8KDP1_SPIIN|nr:unnamed protein product [Spirodela intermedia]
MSLITSLGSWSSISDLPADKITEIDQPASHLLLGFESPYSKLCCVCVQ